LSFFHPILAGASFKDRSIACLGALIGISLTGLVTAAMTGPNFLVPLIVAPIGASAVLLFAVPASPLAQPWSIIGGNTISALVGILAYQLIDVPALAAGVAVALAILLMSLTRSLHPPGGAAALTAVLAGPVVETWGYWFPFVPVALNSCILVAIGLVFHRIAGSNYPHVAKPAVTNHQKTNDLPAAERMGFAEADIDAALARFEESFDITRDDLSRIFRQVEIEGLTRSKGELTCGDIMSRDVISIRRDSSSREARALLVHHNIRTLPVIGDDGILLGTVGIRDLLDDADSITTVKQAAVAREADTILSLLPVLTDGRSHAVIITDSAHRMVGLISQTDLLSAVARLLPRNAG
jgi:CBS domain-containing membrane protein